MQCLVFLIFAKVAVTHAGSPRSVNLALDTVLEFDNKNDVHFIRTLQQFLDKLKITITRSNPDMDDIENESELKPIKMTDFIKEILSEVSSYSDKELEKLTKTVEVEIKAWLERNKIFGTTENGFKRLIDDKLEEFASLPVKEIRRKLKTMSRRLNFSKRNRNNGTLANFLNYFYINESKAKISNFVKNLKLYRSQTRRGIFHLNLKHIIRSGIESIIEPIMQIGAALQEMQSENKRVVTEPEKPTDSISFKDLVKNFVQEAHEEDEDNDILDYIDRYKRIIDKHLTTNAFLKDKRDTEVKSETKKYKATIRTTKKKRKYKPTQSSTEEFESKLRENIFKKRTTVKTTTKVASDESKDTSESSDLSNVKEPFLIKIGSNDESNSEDDYTKITPQITKQRRYKKFTRSQTTTKKSFFFRRKSSKYRKSLVTVSDEGLSIEHFGSLVTPKSHRKSNDNDTFTQNTQTVLNVSHHAVTVVNKPVSTEIIDDNISKNVVRFNTKDQSDNVEKMTEPEVNIHDTKSDVDKFSVTKTINLKGNIFIEKPINITSQNTISLEIISNDKNDKDLSTKKSVNDNKTKYFNIKKIKPTVYLRSHNLNETELTTNTNIETTKRLNSTTKAVEDIDMKKEEVSIKTIDDGLENELESIIDKFNTSSTMPVEFDNFLKESEMNNVKSNIKDQMKADLAKLLTPTTENAVTELYTDPFSELDAIDLIK